MASSTIAEIEAIESDGRMLRFLMLPDDSKMIAHLQKHVPIHAFVSGFGQFITALGITDTCLSPRRLRASWEDFHKEAVNAGWTVQSRVRPDMPGEPKTRLPKIAKDDPLA